MLGSVSRKPSPKVVGGVSARKLDQCYRVCERGHCGNASGQRGLGVLPGRLMEGWWL